MYSTPVAPRRVGAAPEPQIVFQRTPSREQPADVVGSGDGNDAWSLLAWAPHPTAGDPMDARSTSAVFSLFGRTAPAPPFVLVRVRPRPSASNAERLPAEQDALEVEVEDAAGGGGADPRRWSVPPSELRPCSRPGAPPPATAGALGPPPADLADLPVLHDAALLWAAASRWAGGSPGSRLGPRALLLVSPPPPWAPPGLAGVAGVGLPPRTVRRVRHQLTPQSLAVLPPGRREAATLQPCACALAEDALQELAAERRDVAILFAGEAGGGAGRSRAWDAALAYLCCVEAADAEVRGAVEGHLLRRRRRGGGQGGAGRRADSQAQQASGASPLRQLASSSSPPPAPPPRMFSPLRGLHGAASPSPLSPLAWRGLRSPLGAHSAAPGPLSASLPIDDDEPLSLERLLLLQADIACGAPALAPFLDAPLSPAPSSPPGRALALGTVLRAMTRGATLTNPRGSIAGVALRLWVDPQPPPATAAVPPSADESSALAALEAPLRIVGAEAAVVGLDTRGLASALPAATGSPDTAAGSSGGGGIPRVFLLLFQAARALSAAGGSLGEGSALASLAPTQCLPEGSRLAQAALLQEAAAREAAGPRGGPAEGSQPAYCLGEWLAFEEGLRAAGAAGGAREGVAAVVRTLAGIAALCDARVLPSGSGASGCGADGAVVLSDASWARFGDMQGHALPPLPAPLPAPASGGGVAPSDAGARLDTAAEMLGVGLPWLVAALTARPAGSGDPPRPPTFSAAPAAHLVAPAFAGTVRLTLAGAHAAHAGLVRALYQALLQSVVAAANAGLAVPPQQQQLESQQRPPALLQLALLDVAGGSDAGAALAALGLACEGFRGSPEEQAQAQQALFAKLLGPPAAAGPGAQAGQAGERASRLQQQRRRVASLGGLQDLLAHYALDRVEALHGEEIRSQATLCAAEGVPLPAAFAAAARAAGLLSPGGGGGVSGGGGVLDALERHPIGLLPTLVRAAAAGGAAGAPPAPPSPQQLAQTLVTTLRRSGCVAGVSAAQAAALLWARQGAGQPADAPPMLLLRHTPADAVYDVQAWGAEQWGPDAPGGPAAAAAATLLAQSTHAPLLWAGGLGADSAAAQGGLVEGTVAALDAALGWAGPHAARYWVRCVAPHSVGAAVSGAPAPARCWDANRVLAQLQWGKAVAHAALVAQGWGWVGPLREAYARWGVLGLGLLARGGADAAPLPLALQPPSDAPLAAPVSALLARLWAAYPAELAGACGPLAGEAAVGCSRLFLSQRASEALDALRASRFAAMDAAAATLQAALGAWVHRQRFRRARAATLRLQSMLRGRTARRPFATLRGASRTLRRAVAGWLHRRRFLALRRAVSRLQSAFLSRRLARRLSGARAGLAALHALARGFVARARIMQQQCAALTIQRLARAFLARTRAYWARVRGALLMQALWRGHAWRAAHAPLVLLLRKRTTARIVHLRLARLQARRRALPVRATFRACRAAARCLQRWVRARHARRAFLRRRAAAVTLQAAWRGWAAWRTYQPHRQTLALEAEGERVRVAALREAAQLRRHHRAVAAAALARARARHADTPIAAPSAPDSLLLAVDVVRDIGEAFPRGLAGPIAALERRLQATAPGAVVDGIAQIALGRSHALLLTRRGVVWSLGLGAEGQLGHGYSSSAHSLAARSVSPPLAGGAARSIAAGTSVTAASVAAAAAAVRGRPGHRRSLRGAEGAAALVAAFRLLTSSNGLDSTGGSSSNSSGGGSPLHSASPRGEGIRAGGGRDTVSPASSNMPRSPQLLSPQDAGTERASSSSNSPPSVTPSNTHRDWHRRRSWGSQSVGSRSAHRLAPRSSSGGRSPPSPAASTRAAGQRYPRFGAGLAAPHPIEALLSTAAVQAGVPLGPAMKLPGSPPSPQGREAASATTAGTQAQQRQRPPAGLSSAAAAVAGSGARRQQQQHQRKHPHSASSSSPPPGPHAVIARGGVSAAIWGTPTAQGPRVSPGPPRASQPPLAPLRLVVVAVAAGADFSLALTESRRVFAWGANTHGQLGVGAPAEAACAPAGPSAVRRAAPAPRYSALPLEVLPLRPRGVLGVAAGADHALAVAQGGQLFVWGRGGACGLPPTGMATSAAATAGEQQQQQQQQQQVRAYTASSRAQARTASRSAGAGAGRAGAKAAAPPSLPSAVGANAALRAALAATVRGGSQRGRQRDPQTPSEAALSETPLLWMASSDGSRLVLRSDSAPHPLAPSVAQPLLPDLPSPLLLRCFRGARLTVAAVACGWRSTAVLTAEGHVFEWQSVGGSPATQQQPRGGADSVGAGRDGLPYQVWPPLRSQWEAAQGAWRARMGLPVQLGGPAASTGYGDPGSLASLLRVGGRHSLVVTRSGQLWSWGSDLHGQLGIGGGGGTGGGAPPSSSPQRVVFTPAALAAGGVVSGDPFCLTEGQLSAAAAVTDAAAGWRDSWAVVAGQLFVWGASPSLPPPPASLEVDAGRSLSPHCAALPVPLPFRSRVRVATGVQCAWAVGGGGASVTALASAEQPWRAGTPPSPTSAAMQYDDAWPFCLLRQPPEPPVPPPHIPTATALDLAKGRAPLRIDTATVGPAAVQAETAARHAAAAAAHRARSAAAAEAVASSLRSLPPAERALEWRGDLLPPQREQQPQQGHSLKQLPGHWGAVLGGPSHALTEDSLADVPLLDLIYAAARTSPTALAAATAKPAHLSAPQPPARPSHGVAGAALHRSERDTLYVTSPSESALAEWDTPASAFPVSPAVPTRIAAAPDYAAAEARGSRVLQGGSAGSGIVLDVFRVTPPPPRQAPPGLESAPRSEVAQHQGLHEAVRPLYVYDSHSRPTAKARTRHDDRPHLALPV